MRYTLELAILNNMIRHGESATLEFKKTTGQRTDAAKTLCAFLNGSGGSVIFGVTDKGDVVGQEITSKTLEDLAVEFRRIEPAIFPEITTLVLGPNRGVIAVQVQQERGPYTYDGRPYVRHGCTTQVMPREEYKRRTLEEMHPEERWENQPVPDGVTIHDLDEQEIHTTLASAILAGRMEKPAVATTESILLGFKLIQHGKPLNGALALYGCSDKLHILYPHFRVRLGRFRGKDRRADILDNQSHWGHAFALLRKSESFLRDNMAIAGRLIPGNMFRDDYPTYPPLAAREALANALCHRDYSPLSGSTAVAIYDDHVEIDNPGSLHFGLTPAKLMQPHASNPWNPLIASVFYRAGIIEQWGTGTLNMIRWCEDNCNPPPQWEEWTGAVVVTFFHSSPFAETPTFPLILQETAHDTLLDFCSTPRSIAAIMRFLHLKDRNTVYTYHLQPLIEQNYLAMVMQGKTQKYIATNGATGDAHRRRSEISSKHRRKHSKKVLGRV